ncbi:hypothetical protein F544_14360 [Bibersteinia trehalosi USDA-ARS-USMARC-190]|uniref:Glycosyltransferase 2-like domain-containing protein n=1 Tax=Bibersteinia trehalosi USDA-ARS-USMARC-190 TaxID=1263832 RepID=W0R6A5_BIBTR|nr:glycosyltransferase [Bibersteinia trehalosi]AHG86664.1 hypothetical protein F544_14360 [Bibersteinia trehalosi USDA-ARS-USMARC-190]
MTSPKISFIIPIYNTAIYLSECIESILTQRVELEIILVDDGSTDDSLTICLNYVKKYSFITLVHSQNKGQSAARNKAINLAQGKYIYFIDSDDYITGDHFPEIIRVADQYGVDMIRLQAEKVAQLTGKRLAIPTLKANNNVNQGYLLSGKETLSLMVQQTWIPAICWTLIRREFLLKNQLNFIEGIKAEDQLFYLQLLTIDPNATLIELPFWVYCYRIRPNSITTTINPAYFYDHFRMIELINQYFEQHNLLSDESIYHDGKHIVLNLCRTAFNMLNKFPPEVRHECENYLTQNWQNLTNIWNCFK